MQFKSLAFFFLTATALATPEAQQKRDDLNDLKSLVGGLATALPSDLAGIAHDLKSLSNFLPPSGIISVLATAIPPGVRSSIEANPTNALNFNSELHSSLKAGNTPSWYNNLPSDVKSYLNQIGGFTPTGSSSQTGGSASRPTSNPSQSNTPARASGNIAPRATGAIAASFAGVAGLLGVAIML
ncbi:hypothetical protein LOZ57_001780 [Ophidiomyces ophidiicola]|uniref:uncharacterized protein n=1 Tax=Ophidiomyces ophidiicola TaxID=1387563 RepID=UPI0020C42536|nr:uncharacterized protein LOZ57_001780 [Ophidiomyces ophidiicola]KAI1951225.1 hypothetical protein LOZ57_001780 [Ophidiomyces ophidiicola]KAI2060757.1 hypothetical protein LOZ43_001582 [Ophidiomyces ophidiicola]KAI2090217.1 hypothetical protein LOZ36_001429 [Ophidiomyces ophidiicola]